MIAGNYVKILIKLRKDLERDVSKARLVLDGRNMCIIDYEGAESLGLSNKT